MTKHILCFGDSNTWGYSPDDGTRMPERFTRLLARHDGWEIIEEGLNSRNAVNRDPHMTWKYGFDAWKMSLMSHKPLDAIVLMLGTNDLKSNYHCSAKYIASGLREYVREWMNPTLYEGTKKPELVVVSPILLGSRLPELEGPGGNLNEYSVEQSRLLYDQLVAALAPYPVTILNAADYASPSETDQLHMRPDQHKRLANALEKHLETIL